MNNRIGMTIQDNVLVICEITEGINESKEIRKQLERCNELRKVLVGKYEKIIPLVVTFFEENIIEYEDVFVVPLWKFNEFLLDHVETY